MNFEDIYSHCTSKQFATEDYPFDTSTLVFKVGGKLFLLIDSDNPNSINVKCDPEKVTELRENYSCVLPGYHMNKTHWNTIVCDGSVNNKLIESWIDDSYNLVVSGLTKKLKTELDNL